MAKQKTKTSKVSLVAEHAIGDLVWSYEIVGDPYIRLEGPLEVSGIKFSDGIGYFSGDPLIEYALKEVGLEVNVYDECDADLVFSTAEAALKAAKIALKNNNQTDKD